MISRLAPVSCRRDAAKVLVNKIHVVESLQFIKYLGAQLAGQRRGSSRTSAPSRAGAHQEYVQERVQERDFSGLWANTSFEALGVHPSLLQALAAQGIARPTVIQAESFAPVAKGKDTVLRAETGSGKTLAYLLPLINRVYHLHERAKEIAHSDANAPNPFQNCRPWIVLLPTTDLCAQVLAMLESIDADRLVSVQSLQRLFRWEALATQGSFQAPSLKERTFFDSSDNRQQHRPSSTSGTRSSKPYVMASPRIRWGAVDLVVTTPLKFCEDLEQFKEDGFYPACVVMDEADALFQGPTRGYLFDIFAVLRPRIKIRQNDEARARLRDLVPTQFIFSAATMPHIGPHSPGNMLIERFCTADYVETKHFHRLPSGIAQEDLRWEAGSDDWNQRVEQLLEVLRTVPCDRTLVFVNTVHNCHILSKYLKETGWPVVSFMKGSWGRMGPRFNDAKSFSQGEASIMVATDTGGRGIDWPEVEHVVNFQMPTSGVNWLHRVGRTGRLGRRGLVTNFVGSKDQDFSEHIQMRLAAGKDLHGAFSRRRSLPRRLKAQRNEGEAGDAEDGGAGKLDGGIEVYESSFSMGMASPPHHAAEVAPPTVGAGEADDAASGTVIGYLATFEDELDARRRQPRQRGGGRAAAIAGMGGGSGGAPTVGGQEDAELAELRAKLLASDSESDDDEDNKRRSDDDMPRDGRGERRGAAAVAGAGDFDWSTLGDSSAAGGVVGPQPPRQLRDRGQRKDEAPTAPSRTYAQAEKVGGRKSSGRRSLGVRSVNRLAAGGNYASPEDDLLI